MSTRNRTVFKSAGDSKHSLGGQTDEMKLKQEKLYNHIDEELLYPRQLNEQLLKQISSLTSENGDLRQRLCEKESKISELNKNIDSLNENIKNMVSSCGPSVSTKSAGIISAKITDLCKQNRHLVAELESYKTKCSVLERKMITQEPEQEKIKCESEEKKPLLDPDELKELKDKLTVTTRKLIETRNKNTDLKYELVFANKCLQNEIGDPNINLQKLAANPTGFKGRAQEIIILRNKVSELEEKLNINKICKNESVNQVLRDMETKKRSQMDNTIKELEELRVDYAEVKKKLEGTMARLKVVNCEGVHMKQKIQSLLDKSANDDKLIIELNRQQKGMENQYREMIKESTKANESIKMSRDRMGEDYENEKFRVQALIDKLDEKTKKIDHLNEQIARVVESSLQKIYFTPLQIAADNEIKALAVLLVRINNRLEDERKKSTAFEKKLIRIKGNKRNVEKKLSQVEFELQDIKSSKHSSLKSRSTTSINSYKYSSLGTQVSVKSISTLDESVESGSQMELEMYKNKVEVALEQIKCLEVRLQMSEDEREADIECIENMIIQSKKIFAEALKAMQELK